MRLVQKNCETTIGQAVAGSAVPASQWPISDNIHFLEGGGSSESVHL